MRRTLHCVAEGGQDGWEAICLDLDIAVQGDTFEDAYHSLNEAIDLYVESVADLPEADRRRLLARRVPWNVRAGIALRSLRAALLVGQPRPSEPLRHDYTVLAAA